MEPKSCDFGYGGGWQASRVVTRIDHALAESTPQAESTATSSRWRRALALPGGATVWARTHRKLAVATVLAAVALGGMAGWLVLRSVADGSALTIQMALEQLDRRRYRQARAIAEVLRRREDRPYEEMSLVAYVLGMATAREADEPFKQDKQRLYLLAARFLEQAAERGLPADRQADALYQTGRCLVLAGRFAQSRIPLEKALAAWPHRATEIHRLLARANLSAPNPRLEAALAHNDAWHGDPLNAPDHQQQARLERCDILLRLGRADSCREELLRIPDRDANPDALILAGLLRLQEAGLEVHGSFPPQDQRAPGIETQKVNEALAVFKRAGEQSPHETAAARQARYLRGLASIYAGKIDEAVNQLVQSRSLNLGSPEGVAGDLLLGELYQEQGKHDLAVQAYRRAFAQAGPPASYSNRWVTLDELQSRMLRAYAAYIDADMFQPSLDLLAGFRPVFTRTRVIELRAETHRAWGESLLREMEPAAENLDENLRRQAVVQFRSAGKYFRTLAELRRTTRNYTDDVWNSAQSLLLGHDYPGAVKMLQEYLEQEQRKRRPLALLALGRAYLTLGNLDASIQALNECVELHPRDAAVYEARLLASKAYLEKGEGEKAVALLRDNVAGGVLTPASLEWRDSLFMLGRVLNETGRYDQAISRLEEAVERYPDDALATEALYLIADSFQKASSAPKERLRQANIESVRIAERKELRKMLDGALRYYRLAQRRLNRLEEEKGLTPLESVLLRNCYFSQGNVLFDLGLFDPANYHEAITAYSNASTRYQHEPLVLEAFLRIADCYRRLDRPMEARGALEQAKVLWKRLPEDASYTLTTTYSRDEWIRLLDELIAWQGA